MPKFDIDIDICGACNLRCPSCPQGNVTDYRLPQGFMEPEIMARIAQKARSECGDVNISLFNWAEPLLHPRLPELIRIVQDQGIPCHLSTNLNLLPDADALMAANPASLRISNSGFSQELYERTHRGGDIERVKKNMMALAEAKAKSKASTEIFLQYHRYRHNLEDEAGMRAFAENLGFHFHAVWALFFPLEKVLAYLGEEGVSDFPLTTEDQIVIGDLALPLGKALAAAQKYGPRPCPLRENAISLDFQGDFTLCCGIFDARKYRLGNYLDMPLAEIQNLRRNHPLCGLCQSHGTHVYMSFDIDEMDQLALENIDPAIVELLDLRSEIAWERRKERLERLYARFFSGLLSAKQKKALVKRFKRVQNFLRSERK
ncbi:MAG: radical SAM protein [Desulfuromusa sp.]|nr:radical SAM protein [Desulfuromusa sp.]